MLKRLFVLFCVGVAFVFAQAQTHEVLIETNLGNMTVMLYDDTPNHRDMFMRLVNSGHYDGTLFYRVIKDFVVQGGSSSSKKAIKGSHIGYGKSVNINSEFRENRFHKKGALCAPRQPQEINHFKKSDIGQFYFAVGRVVHPKELEMVEKQVNVPIKRRLKAKYYTPRKAELDSLKQCDPAEFNKRLRAIKAQIAAQYVLEETLELPQELKDTYTTIGGIPTLDGEYTVFGEIIDGMEVLDKIAALKTDKNDRPYTDVRMELRVIK